MRLFGPLYDSVMRWAGHPGAKWYLGGVSFAESSFFPIPTALMLAPMVMARRQDAWRLALTTTLASVAGGFFGYLIGRFLYSTVGVAILELYGLEDAFDDIIRWYDQYGVWLVLLAGFSPIPYKIFTLASGVLGLALIPFGLASLVGRGSQFFLVAALVRWGGRRIEPYLHRYIERIGWCVLILAAVTGMVWYWL